MNKYIIPICNLVNSKIKLEKISARSILDCEDKLMEKYSEKFNEYFSDYKEFINIMDSKYDYAIGEITDIETL